MKTISIFSLFVCISISNVTIPEAQTLNSTHLSSDVVEHGGGCRKSSPPGQCCHGGSKPVHCH